MPGRSVTADDVTPPRLADTISAGLAAAADPAAGRAMAAYLKTTMPCLGVHAPQRRAIVREALGGAGAPGLDREGRRDLAERLWSRPHREEKYAALDVLLARSRDIGFDDVARYERLVVEGAWWDLVDPIATRVGPRLFAIDPQRATGVVRRWAGSPDLWLRRSALLAQRGRRDATDEALLFELCAAMAGERDFFVRKAIGWALRDYAATAPDAVAAFVAAHPELSALSVREATRHLARPARRADSTTRPGTSASRPLDATGVD